LLAITGVSAAQVTLQAAGMVLVIIIIIIIIIVMVIGN
jgi:hypothetical protein